MKIPVTNNTQMPMYVASLMIPAGETRHFDINQVPAHLRPDPARTQSAPEEQATATGRPLDGTEGVAIADLAARPVADIIKAIPALNDDDLARLGDIEQGKGAKARKGVLAAIAEATLSRAAKD